MEASKCRDSKARYGAGNRKKEAGQADVTHRNGEAPKRRDTPAQTGSEGESGGEPKRTVGKG